MANVFKKFQGFVDKPKRNSFDLSFQNNLTMQIGKLYPVLCKEVVPGDSFRISSAFGLRFMPLVFPVQTRMNANLHFFYVRNRNLWDDWEDFIGQTKEGLEMPYLYPSESDAAAQYGTKSLADYFGLPSSLHGSYGSLSSGFVGSLWQIISNSDLTDATDFSDFYAVVAPVHCMSGVTLSSTYFEALHSTLAGYVATALTDYSEGLALINDWLFNSETLTDTSSSLYFTNFVSRDRSIGFDEDYIAMVGNPYRFYENTDFENFCLYFAGDVSTYTAAADFYALCYVWNEDLNLLGVYPLHFVYNEDYCSEENGLAFTLDSSVLSESLSSIVTHLANEKVSFTFGVPCHDDITGFYLFNTDNNTGFYFGIASADDFDGVTFGTSSTKYFYTCDKLYFTSSSYMPPFGSSEIYPDSDVPLCPVGVYLIGSNTVNYQDIGSDTSFIPYAFEGSEASYPIKVNALPFRAYESIYNAFYRNEVNDPFYIDGVAEYNKYLANTSGGADSTLYELHNALWEKDFLTSAVQSPQQGVAPLVGVTSSGTFTFADEDGNVYTAKASIGEDGETLTGITSYDQDTPSGSLRMLVDSISHGISINDFRNVNAFQRWLETNIRKGYKYKDQILSHFGVDAKFDVLDMPEFIGGISRPVNVNTVNSSVETDSAPLGSYGGTAAVMGKSDYSVNKYCDEHGFIIGILSVTPVPNYSQVLPKMFLKDSPFDFYFPEFRNIGMQPINYAEVVPVQFFNNDNTADPYETVFGYQRAWYEYLQSVDEIHGDFRLSLQDFVLSRVYDSPPVLGHDFISVDAAEVNDIFAVTGDDYDKILGLVYFDIKASRPMSKFGIPRLE